MKIDGQYIKRVCNALAQGERELDEILKDPEVAELPTVAEFYAALEGKSWARAALSGARVAADNGWGAHYRIKCYTHRADGRKPHPPSPWSPAKDTP